jgi:energy-coupling factor transporter ATP-binding protein EcfA2
VGHRVIRRRSERGGRCPRPADRGRFSGQPLQPNRSGRRFAGRVVFAGAEIQELTLSERLKHGIGLVPQGRCNFPLMSVRENLELGTYTLPRGETKAAVTRMLDLFPMLKERWRVQAGNLSGEEQQILEMAMVMMTGPRLLLLDEPSLGLSPGNQRLVFQTIRDIRAGGMTVVLVEQNATTALRISDIGLSWSLAASVSKARHGKSSQTRRCAPPISAPRRSGVGDRLLRGLKRFGPPLAKTRPTVMNATPTQDKLPAPRG